MKGLEEYLAKLDTLYRKTGKTEFDSLETGIPSAALDALEKMGFIEIMPLSNIRFIIMHPCRTHFKTCF